MKRLILVLVVFVLVAAPLITGTWTLIAPKYEAKGEIRVRPFIPRLVFKTDENGAIPFYDSFVNTQAALLRSPTILQRALDQPAVRQTRWYRSPRKTLRQRWTGDALPLVERLREGLRAQPRPQTEIIDVSFMDTNAKDASVIVNAVLHEYLAYVAAAADEEERRLDQQLNDVYNRLNSEITTQESVRAGYCRDLQTDSPQELIAGKRVRLDETQARINALKITVDVLNREIKQAAAGDGNSAAVATGNGERPKPKYYEDAKWRELDLEVRNAQHQIDNSILRDPNHPDRVRMTRNLEFTKRLLQLREQQLDEQWRDQPQDALTPTLIATHTSKASNETTLVSPEHRLARALQEEQLLMTDLKGQQAEFHQLFDMAQKLEAVNTNLRHKRELFEAVRQRLDQRNMERGVPAAIGLLTRAVCPSKPAPDQRIAFTVGVLLLALCASGSTAFLGQRTNNVPGGTDGAA